MTWRAFLLETLLPSVLALAAVTPATPAPAGLPTGFVYLADIEPSIIQDLRYAGSHNFVGRRIVGYEANEVVMTEKAARALAKVQAKLAARKLSLIIWDAYRPTRATAEFIRWSKDPGDTKMKAEFYPNVDKSRIFELGYLSTRSAHSRGSTVDLGIAPLGATVPAFDPAAKLTGCTTDKAERYVDGALDFGTGYDCMDVKSATLASNISAEAHGNRLMLRDLMVAAGFKPYHKEWWHFELIDEPFPHDSFDFPVRARKR